MRLAALLLLSPSLAFAYGEPGEVPPSLEERALHLHTDRLRVDPGAADSEFDELPAVPPLAWNDDLHEAARFYADDMAENGCFPADHSSCDGTTFGTRLAGYYSGSPIGENIATGQIDAETAVYDSWLYSGGHRANMLSGDYSELGAGHAAAGPLWVQDFGYRPLADPPIATSGTHDPLRPPAEGEVAVTVAVHDAAAAPRSVRVVWDTVCQELELDRGTAAMGTYAGEVTAGPEGCVPYWFRVERADGSVAELPETGAWLAPVGAAQCEVATGTRPAAPCAGRPGGGLGGIGEGCGASGEGYGADGAVEDDVAYGSCALAPGTASTTLPLALLAVARRRRR
jgi:hypothetical protein